MKQAIWALKYKKAIDLAETFARAMSDTLFEELADELILPSRTDLKAPQGRSLMPIVLIPVPLSKKRLRQRGYNQAEELAKQMVKLNPEQFTLEKNLVKKIKDTPTQVSLKDRAKRLANLKGAFELATPKTGGQSLPAPRSLGEVGRGCLKDCPRVFGANTIFVIIDDVSTTGTTIGEIRRILKINGFYRTYGLVLAHG